MYIFVAIVFAFLQQSNGFPPRERIHGGVDAPPKYAPHMVALLSDVPWRRMVCGASVVTRKHVLTAAHCVTPFLEGDQLLPTLYGRVGSNIWHSGGATVYFQQGYVHPLWDEDVIKYDVAVLLLKEPLKLSDSVAVIGLDFGWVGGGEEMSVTGWGVTWPKFTNISVNMAPIPDELQLLYVWTLWPAECERRIQADPHWAAMAPHLDPSLEICTFHSIRHGVCNGDSGSALVSTVSGKMVGLVSWGIPCAAGAPDFHTRLLGIREFLLSIINHLELEKTHTLS